MDITIDVEDYKLNVRAAGVIIHNKFHSFLASLKGTHRNESLELEAFSLYNISREYILQSTVGGVADFCNFQIKSA